MADVKAINNAKEQNSSRQTGGMTAPYFDLDSSIKVAEAIQKNSGGTCAPDQLAHWLDYSSTRSGTYLTRMSAATKHFGLIESNGRELVVTDRGHKILSPVMPEDAINAKVEAFLSAPLFSLIFDEFRGRQLPPEIGLKNLFQTKYKMPADRATAAVRIFMNSAEQSGLLTSDRTRLVKPAGHTVVLPPKADESPPTPAEKHKSSGGGGDGGTGGVHTAIVGLLRDLPPPGTQWSPNNKKRFLDAFKATIDFIYPDPDSEEDKL